MANTEQANANSLNFLDNHDTPRFLTVAGGNTDKLLCALCAMIMLPGMPCIFYGTEIPLNGGGDPDCRKPFDWTFAKQNAEYDNNFKRILALKKQRALCGGDACITAENGLLKITRAKDGEIVTAYFNTSGRAKSVNFGGQVLFGLNYQSNKILNDGAIVVKNII